MARERYGTSIFRALFAALIVILVFILKEIVGNEVSDAIIDAISSMLGVENTAIVEWLKPYLLPLILASLIAWLMYRIAYWHLQSSLFIDDPTRPAEELQQMTIPEIASYLRDDSEWGWKLKNKRDYPPKLFDALISKEISDSGKWEKVRFVGSSSTQVGNTMLIDRSIWNIGALEPNKLWDPLQVFNAGQSRIGNISAPRIDIYSFW